MDDVRAKVVSILKNDLLISDVKPKLINYLNDFDENSKQEKQSLRENKMQSREIKPSNDEIIIYNSFPTRAIDISVAHIMYMSDKVSADENDVEFYDGVEILVSKMAELEPKSNDKESLEMALNKLEEKIKDNNIEKRTFYSSLSWVIACKACEHALKLINSNTDLSPEITGRRKSFIELFTKSLDGLLVTSEKYKNEGRYFLAKSYAEKYIELAGNKNFESINVQTADKILRDILIMNLSKFKQEAACYERRRLQTG